METLEGPKAWSDGLVPSSCQLIVACLPPENTEDATGEVTCTAQSALIQKQKKKLDNARKYPRRSSKQGREGQEMLRTFFFCIKRVVKESVGLRKAKKNKAGMEDVVGQEENAEFGLAIII